MVTLLLLQMHLATVGSTSLTTQTVVQFQYQVQYLVVPQHDVLREGIFAVCNAVVDPAPFIDDCVSFAMQQIKKPATVTAWLHMLRLVQQLV